MKKNSEFKDFLNGWTQQLGWLAGTLAASSSTTL